MRCVSLMKRIFLSALSITLAACATLHQGGGEQRFRVMTWNIHAGHGNLSGIASTIEDVKPDIVALQEVDVHWSDRSAFVDQVDSLGKLLHMQARFAPIYSFPDSAGTKPPREFGVAILTRYPVTEWKNHTISRLSTQEENPVPRAAPGFLETAIDVRGTTVRAFDTHLDYRADPRVRQIQVGEMLEVMRGFNGPMILFGDMNAKPNAAELRPLFDFLHDALPLGDNAGTYPAEAPNERIDYVFVSKDVHVETVRVLPTAASDHRPVIADLSLKVK